MYGKLLWLPYYGNLRTKPLNKNPVIAHSSSWGAAALLRRGSSLGSARAFRGFSLVEAHKPQCLSLLADRPNTHRWAFLRCLKCPGGFPGLDALAHA